MHPSKVTLRPKVRRPMACDSTKSAPSAPAAEPSAQCPIPGGYRRAEPDPSRAIPHAIRRTDTSIGWSHLCPVSATHVPGSRLPMSSAMSLMFRTVTHVPVYDSRPRRHRGSGHRCFFARAFLCSLPVVLLGQLCMRSKGRRSGGPTSRGLPLRPFAPTKALLKTGLLLRKHALAKARY
jgi:hypothetical protein